MFDFISEMLARVQAQDPFAGARPAAVPTVGDRPLSLAAMPGATGVASPGVLSPTAETVLDEPERPYTGLSAEEEYRERRAAMDARDGDGGSFLARALARMRGQNDDAPIAPEAGAPAHARPLRDPATVIAEAMATAARPPAGPAPERERPYTGLSPEEEYRQRRAALDARPRKAAGG